MNISNQFNLVIILILYSLHVLYTHIDSYCYFCEMIF